MCCLQEQRGSELTLGHVVTHKVCLCVRMLVYVCARAVCAKGAYVYAKGVYVCAKAVCAKGVYVFVYVCAKDCMLTCGVVWVGGGGGKGWGMGHTYSRSCVCERTGKCLCLCLCLCLCQ